MSVLDTINMDTVLLTPFPESMLPEISPNFAEGRVQAARKELQQVRQQMAANALLAAKRLDAVTREHSNAMRLVDRLTRDLDAANKLIAELTQAANERPHTAPPAPATPSGQAQPLPAATTRQKPLPVAALRSPTFFMGPK